MPKATCPYTGEVIEGTLVEISTRIHNNKGKIRIAKPTNKRLDPKVGNSPKSPQVKLDRLDLFVPNELTPTNNSLIRFTIPQKHAEKQRWKDLLKPILNCLPPDHEHKWYLKLVRCTSGQFLDKDNLYGGCKALIDIIRDCRIIPDDKPEYFDFDVDQLKVKRGESGMMLSLTRVSDETTNV